MEFKEKLKELRIKKQLTQEALGEMLHVSRSLIAKWESGLGIPTEDSIDKICEIFNITREQLMFDKNVEKIFVKKNIEINKVKKYLIILGILLLLLVTFTLIYFINDYSQKKNIEKIKDQLTPIVTEISLNYYGPVSNYSQTKYLHNNKYVLLQREDVYLFMTIEIDERIYSSGYYFYDIEIPGVGILNQNYISLVDELVKGDSNPKVFKNIYAIQLHEFDDVTIDKLYIKSMKYGKIFDEDVKSKTVEVQSSYLNISIHKNKNYGLIVKVNNEVLTGFSCLKGTSITEFGISNSVDTNISMLLEKLLNEKYKDFFDNYKVEFNGWRREDYGAIYDKLYQNTVLEAVLKPKYKDTVYNVEALNNEECHLLYRYYPKFKLNGEDYSNVKYELSCDSDIIKIEYGTFMFLKPGRAEINVKYDLGFYKGETSFIVEANKKFANVYIGASKQEHIFYDEEKQEICFSSEQLEEIKKHYEEECDVFFKNKGVKRSYVGLKQIDYNYYIPVFDNDKKYNYQDKHDKFISGDYVLLDDYYNLNNLPTEIRMNISDSIRFDLNFDSLKERIINDDHTITKSKGKVYQKMIVEDNNIIDLINTDYNYRTARNYGETILKIYFEIHLNDGSIYYEYQEIKIYIE